MDGIVNTQISAPNMNRFATMELVLMSKEIRFVFATFSTQEGDESKYDSCKNKIRSLLVLVSMNNGFSEFQSP